MVTTIPGVAPYKIPDRVERRRDQGGLNRVWISDITYLRTGEGWLYLAAVTDAHSRRIPGMGDGLSHGYVPWSPEPWKWLEHCAVRFLTVWWSMLTGVPSSPSGSPVLSGIGGGHVRIPFGLVSPSTQSMGFHSRHAPAVR